METSAMIANTTADVSMGSWRDRKLCPMNWSFDNFASLNKRKKKYSSNVFLSSLPPSSSSLPSSSPSSSPPSSSSPSPPCSSSLSCISDKHMILFNHFDDSTPRCGACVWSSDGRMVLMVKQKISQKWGIPKGTQEPAESTQDCMLREVKEETGLNLSLLPHRVVGIRQVSRCYIYLIQLLCSPPKHISKDYDTTEIERIEWVPVPKINDLWLNSITRCLSKMFQKQLLVLPK